MERRRATIKLTPEQREDLLERTLATLNKSSSLTPPGLFQEEDGWAAELTSSTPDGNIEIVAQVYVKQTLLKEYYTESGYYSTE